MDDFPPEKILALARPYGVDRVVLIQTNAYMWDNRYIADSIRRFGPSTFAGVGLVDPDSPDAAETMRRLARDGIRGFRLQPELHASTWTSLPGLKRMWTRAAEDGLVICPLLNPDALPGVDRMCAQHPDTPVVIDHFGRIGLDGQIREEEVRTLCALARHLLTHVKISAFFALGKRQAPYLDLIPLVRRLYEAFGPNRLMWASDCPYLMRAGHIYADSVQFVRDRLDFISAADREWLLWKTAGRLFFPPLAC
jgi:predicted TIM-barrel fold metal-dependent hydrolase